MSGCGCGQLKGAVGPIKDGKPTVTMRKILSLPKSEFHPVSLFQVKPQRRVVEKVLADQKINESLPRLTLESASLTSLFELRESNICQF